MNDRFDHNLERLLRAAGDEVRMSDAGWDKLLSLAGQSAKRRRAERFWKTWTWRLAPLGVAAATVLVLLVWQPFPSSVFSPIIQEPATPNRSEEVSSNSAIKGKKSVSRWLHVKEKLSVGSRADRVEPTGSWGKDDQSRITFNGVFFTGVQTLWSDDDEDNAKTIEVPYRKGVINGIRVTRYASGQKASEMTYREGKLDGVSLGWHKNGKESWEKTYRDGMIVDGTYVHRHANGQKALEETYREGKIDGVYSSWHLNGQKSYEVTYRDGIAEGTAVTWHPDGRKQSEFIYVQGKVVEKISLDDQGGENRHRVIERDTGQLTLKKSPNFGAQLKEDPRGLNVTALTPETPAARASLQVGDRLLTLEGQSVPKTVADFLAQLAAYAEGSQIKLTVERAGARHTTLLPWVRQNVPSTGSGEAFVKKTIGSLDHLEKPKENPAVSMGMNAISNPIIRTEPTGTWGINAQTLTTLNEISFTGTRTDWFKDGSKLEVPFRKGAIEGIMVSWYSDGRKNEEMTYRNGKKDGSAIFWYQTLHNGGKRYEGTYREGKENGIFVGWHPNGQKESERTYRDGELDGISGTWYPNGQQKTESTFRSNKQVGAHVFWTEKGRIVMLHIYDEEGVLVSQSDWDRAEKEFKEYTRQRKQVKPVPLQGK